MTTHRRTTRLATLLVGAATATIGFASPALASAPTASGATTATPAGYSNGYNDVINGHGAFLRLMDVEGTQIKVFCVEEAKDFDAAPANVFTATARAAAGISAPDKAADAAVRSSSIGTPLADANSEAVAAQLAVWKFSDNLDYSSVNNDAIKARADAIVAGTGSRAESPTGAKLSMAATRDGSTDTVTVTLVSAAGSPLVGEYVTLKGAGLDKKVQTDAAGKASAQTTAPAAESEVTAAWTGVLAAGSILKPTTPGSQAVITVDPAPISRSAVVSLAAAPAPTPPATVAPPVEEPPVTAAPPVEAPPATVAPPVTEPPATPSKPELPFTGTSVTPLMLLGALALAGAGFYAKRHRTS